MPVSDRFVLEKFVEDADELFASNFAAEIRESGVSTAIKITDRGLCSAPLSAPQKDALKACLLTIRLFGQNNDPLSFCNIAKRTDALTVPQALKDRFNQIRKNFNAYLDSPPVVQVRGATADTNRIIFETFLYGMFAHRNEPHVERLKSWEVAPFFADLLAQFNLIAFDFINAARAMAAVVREMLELPS